MKSYSALLEKARQYESIEEQAIRPEEKPLLHLSPRAGWMNDPNGFSYYNGCYHLFYQYHPYSSYWGPMHWGHAVSKDLLHWTHLPAALAPDMPYDRDGCFSGTAETLPDGRQVLIYTGVLREAQSDGSIRDTQTQCIAIGDGTDYEKYEGNPVIDGSLLPADASRSDFRDPRITREADGSYSLVAVNRKLRDGLGQVLLFHSHDAIHWEFVRVLKENDGNYGIMWECPDYFTLQGQRVLLLSAQDMQYRGEEYHAGDGSFCFLGSSSGYTDPFTTLADQNLDNGMDFYAPETVLAPDGRRIMIGWMQNWDSVQLRSKEHRWYGQMAIPRELRIQDGHIYQWPIRELDACRRDPIVYKNVALRGRQYLSLDGVHGRVLDLELSLRPEHADALYHSFSMQLACDGDVHTDLRFYPESGRVELDRRFSGTRRAIQHRSEAVVLQNEGAGTIHIRIILDRFSVEVFLDQGYRTLTHTIDTDLSADEIRFAADGAFMDLSCFQLT